MWKSLYNFILISCLLFVAVPSSAAQITRLNVAEKVWLDAHQVLRVGVVESTPPILSYQGRVQPKGVAVDYLRALALHLGLQLEIKRFDDESALSEALSNAEIDLIGAVPYGLDDSKPWLYTRPYLSLPVALFGTDDLSVTGLSELRGKSVAVVEGSVWDEGLHSLIPGVNAVSFSNMEMALKAVAERKVTAFLSDVASTEYLLDQKAFGEVEERFRSRLTYDISVATPQQIPELQSLIQKGLERIGDQELSEIWLRWPNVERPEDINGSFPLWAIWLPLLAVWTFLVAYVVRRYTKQKQIHLHGRMKAKISRLRRREMLLKAKMLRLKQKALSYRKELRKHRQQIVLLSDVMPSAAWEWDASTGQCQWDKGMYDFFQADEANFEPTPEAILDLVHEDDRDKVSTLFSSEPENNEVQMSYRVVLPDGRTKWMLDYSHGSEEEEGSQRVGICWDVSDYQLMIDERSEG
jgi:ABC-type amino acid transport substrate-binding protein